MSLVLPSGLTAAQAAIWLDQHLFAGKPIYNTGQFLTIRGKLRLDLFETALRQAVAESPGLRLAPHSGPVPFELALLDFRQEKDPCVAADQWMRSEMGKAIPLEDPALFRGYSDQRRSHTLAPEMSPHYHGRDQPTAP